MQNDTKVQNTSLPVLSKSCIKYLVTTAVKTRTPFSGTQLTITMALEKNKLPLLSCPSCNRCGDLRLPRGPKPVPEAKMRRQARQPREVQWCVTSGTKDLRRSIIRKDGVGSV